MSDTNGYIAEMLRISARGYAARAAEQLLEQHPETGAAFGDSAFRNWQDHLAQRLTELAIAVELDAPALFSAQLEWSRDAFAAREVPTDHLRQSIRGLRAVLLEDLPEGVRETAIDFLDPALARLEEAPQETPRLTPNTDASQLALRYLEAVLSGQRRRAMRLVLDAVENGLEISAAYEEVLLPAQAEIGTMWHLGEISIPEEHTATETTRMVMSVLSWHAPPEAEGAPVVLVAAVEGDRHDIGVRAVADLVELAGFRSILLGADVPVHDLAGAIEDFSPDVLILAASLSTHLRPLRDSIRAIRDTPAGADLSIVVGGPAFAAVKDIAGRIDADAYAESPTQAVAIVGKLARTL